MMTLRELYSERSYYFLRLEEEMVKIVRKGDLNGFSQRAIKAFCTGTFGDLPLEGTKDYNSILESFRIFTAGIVWAQANIAPVEVPKTASEMGEPVISARPNFQVHNC